MASSLCLLAQCRAYVLTCDANAAKRATTAPALAAAGLTVTYVVSAPTAHGVPPSHGAERFVLGALGHVKLLEAALADGPPPFLVLEDDTLPRSRGALAEPLRVPADADAVYVGLSGGSKGARSGPLRADATPDVDRVFNMFSMHGYLVCTARYALALACVLTEAAARVRLGASAVAWDYFTTDLSRRYAVYATRTPRVYQDEALGGQQWATLVRFGAPAADAADADVAPLRHKAAVPPSLRDVDDADEDEAQEQLLSLVPRPLRADALAVDAAEEPAAWVAPRLQGGVGNRLFALAAASAYAAASRRTLVVFEPEERVNAHSPDAAADRAVLAYWPQRLRRLARAAAPPLVLGAQTDVYTGTLPRADAADAARGVVLDGYWQHGGFADGSVPSSALPTPRALLATAAHPLAVAWRAVPWDGAALLAARRPVRLSLPPPPAGEDAAAMARTAFVHVRRGDYKAVDVLPPAYYVSALARLSPDAPLLLFSEDPALTPSAFAAELGQPTLAARLRVASPTAQGHEALAAMARCGGGGVLANSSLSWWAARAVRDAADAALRPRPPLLVPAHRWMPSCGRDAPPDGSGWLTPVPYSARVAPPPTWHGAREALLLDDASVVALPRVLRFVFEDLCTALPAGMPVRVVTSVVELHDDAVVLLGDAWRCADPVGALAAVAPRALYFGWYWQDHDTGRLPRFVHVHENYVSPPPAGSGWERWPRLMAQRHRAPLLLRATVAPHLVGSLPRAVTHDYAYCGATYLPDWVPSPPFRGVYHAPGYHTEYLGRDARRALYLSAHFALGFQCPEGVAYGHVSQRIFEGLAYGCVVLTNSAAAVEQTRDAEGPLCVLVGGRDELGAAMRELLADRPRMARLQERGYAWARVHGTATHALARLADAVPTPVSAPPVSAPLVAPPPPAAPPRLVLGHQSYVSPTYRIHAWEARGASAEVRVGKYCSLGAELQFYIDGDHNSRAVSTYPFRDILKWERAADAAFARGKGPPSVGNDVWLCNSVVLHSGVHVGDGAVVAANSVVTKSVPPYAIVAGNPAIVKRFRFPSNLVARFVAAAWWDLPEAALRPLVEAHYTDAVAFLTAVERCRALVNA